MRKSAKECIKEAMFSSLIESMGALRQHNVDNAVLREIKAMHGNTSFGDLPDPVKHVILNAVDLAFTKLASQGYTVTTRD